MVNETLITVCESIINGQHRASKLELLRCELDAFLTLQLGQMSAGQFAWHIVHNTWAVICCKICSNPTSYNVSRRAYATYCCKACGYADPTRTTKIAETMTARYGVSNAAHSTAMTDKKKKTLIDKYGVDHPSKSQDIKNKKKDTMQTRWGVDNPSQSFEIQQQKIKTNQAIRGVDWPTQDPAVQQQQQATNLKKYGSASSLSNTVVRAKANQTMMDRYGTIYPQQNATIRSATISTNLTRYGVDHPSKSQDIKNKISATNIEKYGTSSWRSSDIGKETLQQIHLDRRGVTNPSKDPAILAKIRQTMQSTYGVDHNNYKSMNPTTVAILQSSLQFADFVSGITVQAAAEQLLVHESTIYRLSNEYNCRHLMDLSINSYELKITNLLDSYNISYQLHNRQLLAPKEIDIYLPDYSIGIEVGALYHHGERAGRNSHYHYNKWQQCCNLGIDLFQWFDDELFDYWHLTSARLRRAIGIAAPVVGARKIVISSCTVAEERQFLDHWHLKGFTNNRNVTLAGKFNGEIIAIMCIHQLQDHAIIERWATNVDTSFPGLFSKMLAYWQKTSAFSGVLSTWCDNRLGNGRVYQSTGFTSTRVSKPGYWYFKNHGLEHRQKYQKNKLTKLFDLSSDDVLQSEWNIMQDRGYDRLWDAGHTLWSKYI